MLDDTLAESIGTHFPLTWRDTMQNLDNSNAFFAIALTPNLSEDSYALCLQCISELASCRISLFENFELRKKFVHNFASNLSEVMKQQSEYFCSSRLLVRNYIKVFYKFEMNFQVRSFGLKEQSDIDTLVQYLENLSELTILLIKSGQQYLRDATIPLIAAWNRVNIELQSQSVSCHDKIKEKINDIIVEYIEQNISDLTEDNEEEEDEQFNEAELNTLTQRFDILARLCNIHIESTFSRLDEGLSFLMSNYEENLKKNDTEKMEIIEKRFAWTTRTVTALVNLGYSPKKTEEQQGPDEYDVCVKIIEIIRLNVQLSMEQTHKMHEKLELAILSYISTLRSNVLADPRVVSKVMENDEDTISYRSEGYLRIADKLSPKDILEIVEIFLKKMILNFFSDSEPIIEQNLEMLRTFVSSPGTHKFLMTLNTTQDLLDNHFTKYVFLNSEPMLDYLSGFYRVLTIFWEVNDTVDNFVKYMKPCSEFIANLLSQDANTFVQRKSDILRVCYILTGVTQGFTNADSFNQFFDWFYPNHFKIIAEVFKHFSDDLSVLKGLFKLMRELLDNKTHRLKADSCYLSGFLLFKEISSILLEYFNYVNMYQNTKIKNDKYEEKYQFIEIAVDIFGNIVSGNYINFAI